MFPFQDCFSLLSLSLSSSSFLSDVFPHRESNDIVGRGPVTAMAAKDFRLFAKVCSASVARCRASSCSILVRSAASKAASVRRMASALLCSACARDRFRASSARRNVSSSSLDRRNASSASANACSSNRNFSRNRCKACSALVKASSPPSSSLLLLLLF